MLSLVPLAAGLCAPGTTALQRSPRPLCARLRPVLPAPRMAAPDEEEAAPRTGKSEVFGEMSAEAQARPSCSSWLASPHAAPQPALSPPSHFSACLPYGPSHILIHPLAGGLTAAAGPNP